MRKLDIFTHIWPKKFHELLLKTTGQMKDMHRRSEAVPMMTNLDRRFEVMDMFDEYQQILSLASPPPDVAGDRAAWRELSRIATDAMKLGKRSGYFWQSSAMPSLPMRESSRQAARSPATSGGGEASERIC